MRSINVQKKFSVQSVTGGRLKEDILKCKINNKNIYDYCTMSIENLIIDLEGLNIKTQKK